MASRLTGCRSRVMTSWWRRSAGRRTANDRSPIGATVWWLARLVGASGMPPLGTARCEPWRVPLARCRRTTPRSVVASRATQCSGNRVGVRRESSGPGLTPWRVISGGTGGPTRSRRSRVTGDQDGLEIPDFGPLGPGTLRTARDRRAVTRPIEFD
jgi:hypothetical protein